MIGAFREVYLGLDVGTQGVRVIALDERGDQVASAREAFPLRDAAEEQSPEVWWDAAVRCLSEAAAELAKDSSLRPVALSVTSTSGTVIPLDRHFQPLHNALMYSDKRADEEVQRISALAPELGANVSWGLPKMVWFQKTFPETAERIGAWRHACDFLIGRSTGSWDRTDVTTALKTGFDLVESEWPVDLFRALGLSPDLLPVVVRSGTVVGNLLSEIAELTGLPETVVVTTGMTDGCASQVASGAVSPGDWNTTIGTTMVVKGVTKARIEDPLGRVYSHRHPDGYWMPGGASNTGADWISRDYPNQDLDRLEQEARQYVPTGEIAYPLRQNGERFPFLSAAARGFDPEGLAGAALYAARLEGVAYLERMAYNLLAELSGEPVTAVYTAGGGSRSELWLQIRASVLGLPIHRARHGEGAAGAAIVAAAGTRYASLGEAARALNPVVATIEPNEMHNAYEDGYRRFRETLIDKGYLKTEENR